MILLTSLCFWALALVGKILFHATDNNHPLGFSNYSHTGYYKIYPETINDKLNRGEFDVFAPASEDMFYRDESYYPEIHWSQSDYLRIVDAASREIWHEPLDLTKWSVLSLFLQQDCVDNPQGFYDFDIVYFQNSKIGIWDRQYQARHIEVISWRGFVFWGEDTFSDALLPSWGSAKLGEFQVKADDALFIAESNGGATMRQHANGYCLITTSLNNYPYANGYSNDNWRVNYGIRDFYIWINPLSGKFGSKKQRLMVVL